MIQITRSTRKTSQKTRDLCLQSFDRLTQRKDIGFFQLPEREAPWRLTEERVSQLSSQFQNFVFVGIGGSGLGGRTVRDCLNPQFQNKQISFLENVDPVALNFFFQSYKSLDSTHWVFISKSGSTLETLALANAIQHYLSKNGMDLSHVSTVISEVKESPLTIWAQKNNIPVLPIDLDVGGRFSVLTPVGLMPAAALGASLKDMRQGANWSLQQKDLIAELAAQILESFQREEWVTQFWFYSNQLKTFGDWIQQLWAESLAKKQDIHGKPAPRVSTPMGCLGTNDQHSILQQVMEGYRDKFLWVSRVKSVETFSTITTNLFVDYSQLNEKSLANVLSAEAEATYSAFEEVGLSALELEWRDLSPECLSAGFMLFELIVGTLGEALEINVFNQPGVELGKKLAKKILDTNTVVRPGNNP